MGAGYTKTINAVANAADGSVRNANNNWTTCRTAATGSQTSSELKVQEHRAGGTYFIWRGFTTFDLSVIPAHSKITSAILKLSAVGSADDDLNDDIHVVEGSQSNSITTADFDAVGETSFGLIDFSTIVANSYNNITLNSTGESFIEDGIGGTIKIAVMGGRDLNAGAAPGEGTVSECDFDGAEDAEPPQLVLTYLPPVGGGIIGG